MHSRRGPMAPACSTRSRHSAESPAMLPSAQAACSRTSSLGLASSSTKSGTAPWRITMRVCSAVPLAMLVSAQALSNCSLASGSRRPRTKSSTTPASITSRMGGCFSMESSLRNCCVAEKRCARSRLRSCTVSSGIRRSCSTSCSTLGFCLAFCCMLRRFMSVSSRLFLRMLSAMSPRFLRASVVSIPFLKWLRRASCLVRDNMRRSVVTSSVEREGVCVVLVVLVV
mmetsp:Transcript_44671/g.112597  ORF Transcript_44671/g.112597 Transcript_44671/m.112597 type:complete len:227 (-) Transcript_44671:119-799(-)